jgi:hypothetical protein
VSPSPQLLARLPVFMGPLHVLTYQIAVPE